MRKPRRPKKRRYADFNSIAVAHRDAMLAAGDMEIETLFARIADIRALQVSIKLATDPMIGPRQAQPVTKDQQAEIDRIVANLGQHSRGDREQTDADRSNVETANEVQVA
jgi:hypothetical protein